MYKRQIITHASRIGKRSITAFLPENAEGTVRERALRETAGALGIPVNIFKYGNNAESITTTVAEALTAVQGSDSIYIPAAGGVPNLIMSNLSQSGILIQDKQILGSGLWESINPVSTLNGALYPARDLTKFENFATRYQGKFGVRPGAQACLLYTSDAADD